jgi:hypothetical protein
MRLRSVLATVTAGLAAATSLTAAGPAVADTRACSPAVSITSYSDALDKTTYDGTFVGNLSALAVDRGGRIAALSDRSSLFTLDRRTAKPTSVVNLADEKGAALDSEGLAVDRDGTRLVTSETEPSVRRYERDGTLVGSLPVPDALKVTPAGRATSNLTFEGLTLLPGGHTLLAAMEGSLRGDTGGIVRFQTWDRTIRHHDFRLSAQYGYRTDTGLGVSEAQAAPDGRLLVLERGFTAGVGNTRPSLPRRPPPRHGHPRHRHPDRPGRRAARPQDAPRRPRELSFTGRPGQAAPAQPAPRQHRGADDHRPHPGRPPHAPAGQRRQPERRTDHPPVLPERPPATHGERLIIAEG